MNRSNFAPVTLLLMTVLTMTLIIGCTPVVVPPSTPAASPPVSSGELSPNSVIFSEQQTTDNLVTLANLLTPPPEGAWTPSTDNISALEAALPAFLETAEHPWLRLDPPIVQRAPNYMRQYSGLIVNGEEIIHANFFCNAHEIDWHIEIVDIMDGGDCYFQLKYDPQSGEFFDLSVNGEA